MKKFILGCVLLLSGIIGFSGWMIACTNHGGAFTHVLSYLRGEEIIIALVFVVMTICGLTISLIEIKKDN